MERKVKYNYEMKLRCVQEVLQNHRSENSVAIENNIDRTDLRKWIAFYQKYGSESLLSRKNKIYSVDFKIQVLEAMKKKSLSLSETCVTFNIPSQSVIINWKRKYDEEGYSGLVDKPKGRPNSMNFKRAKKKSNKPLTREEELLLEIESLRAQNDLLKKLQALIQAEEAEPNKKLKP